MPQPPRSRRAPVFDHQDAGGPTTDPELGALPIWDFTGLYEGDESAAAQAVEADFEWAAKECRAFAEAYQGRLAEADGDALAAMITRYEAIEERIGRAMSYVALRYQQRSTDPGRAKAFGDAQARATDATAPLVFFTLELNRVEEAELEAKLASSAALARFRPWLERLRALRPHQLSDELERFLHDQSVVGAAAWNRLFDETMAALTFKVADGQGATETLGLEPTLTRLTDAQRPRRGALRGVRRQSAAFHAHHEHARQREGDRRSVAAAGDAAGGASSGEPGGAGSRPSPA